MDNPITHLIEVQTAYETKITIIIQQNKEGYPAEPNDHEIKDIVHTLRNQSCRNFWEILTKYVNEEPL